MISEQFTTLAQVNAAIVACEKCARLRQYCAQVAQEKRRAFREETYWGKPLPGFGDPQAQLLIVGLAPAAHGGNRTGRMFTGDRSGDFLYAALHRAGFANQPIAVARDDGLQLQAAYIAASARCAPPDNKPTPEEFNNCRPYLSEELRLLKHVRVIVALGKIAFDNVLVVLADRGVAIPRPRPAFGHEVVHQFERYTLIGSYHPSQRNTQTGLLTSAMFDRIFQRAREIIRASAVTG
ncbi:MAG TPA: uracil-DNA glycosylase [Anaerolineae bacterium]|nr:uracil-DNA glycosylase [Anaerolineae bacterium]